MRKEVERIIGGTLASRSDRVKLSHVYTWAGAQAESLIDARINEDPELTITTPAALLDQLVACLTHSTFFREKREEFYNVQKKAGNNTITYVSRIMDLYRLAEFPDNSQFLMVDMLIQGCVNRQPMAKVKDVSVKNCLEVMSVKSECAFILGLEFCKKFRLITIAPVCA